MGALDKENLENESLNEDTKKEKQKRTPCPNLDPFLKKKNYIDSIFTEGNREENTAELKEFPLISFSPVPWLCFSLAEYFAYGPWCSDLHPCLWVAVGQSWQLSQSNSG